MSSRFERVSGTTVIFFFCLMVAGSDVFVGHWVQKIDPIFLLLATSTITWVLFLSLKATRLATFGDKMAKGWRDILWVNVCTTGLWFGFYYSVKFLQPAIALAIYSGVGPILTIAFHKRFRPHVKTFSGEKVAAVGIFLTLLAFLFLTGLGKTAVGDMSIEHLTIGFFSALLCGISAVIFSLSSKRLSDNGWSPGTIMAVRYPLVLMVAGIAFWMIAPRINWSWELGALVVAISVLSGIVPPYLFQVGVERAEPLSISILLVLIPVLTIAFERLDARLNFSAGSLCAILLTTLFLWLGIASRRYRF